MKNEKEKFKEQLQKKTLQEIEAAILSQKQKISAEKNLSILLKLNSELDIMQETRVQKLKVDGRLIRKNSPSAKAELKSFDDYVKSKK